MIHYVQANNKYMYVYDESNMYVWICFISQLLLYGRFEFAAYLSVVICNFIMNYNEESNIGYTLVIDVDYPVYLQPLHRFTVFT